VGTVTRSVLDLDWKAEADRIALRLREALRELARRGLVVAVSGGIDSSVCAALAVRALGPDRVFCLMLPESDGSPSSLERGQQLVDHLGVRYDVQDISATLRAIGCYAKRDEAVRSVFPDYDPSWRYKIAITGGLDGRYNSFELIVQRPDARDGKTETRRLGGEAFLQMVAATNYKQRIRKTIEFFHADRLNYAVTGTPNRLEYDQGFFVKNGDGSADVKPIAHLYKTQVYQLARHLGLPSMICQAVPTTDTYSLWQGQDEFYYALPYEQMDYALWAKNHGVSAEELGRFLNISVERAERVYKDIEVKRATTRYLHRQPILAVELDPEQSR
jgi:NAD+ synthase